MQFTLAAAAQPEAAQLFVCTEAGQLNDETAQLLCHSLEEKDSFAETKLPVSGSLKNIAVLRFADLQQDEPLIEWARQAAPQMLARYPALAGQHVQRWLGARMDYLKA